MGARNDILYPGAILDYENESGDVTPISELNRAALTISANLESVTNTTASLSATVANPALDTVRQGIRTIVSNNIKEDSVLPISLTMDINEVTSQDEFFMNLGLGVQFKKLDLAENFTYDKITTQTNLVVVLKQVYYTIDVSRPSSVKGFFRNMSNKDINEALAGTVPVYVSSVSYGRIAFISIQSNCSRAEIEQELGVAWGKMSENPGEAANKKLSVDFDSTLNYMAQDSTTKISYFVYGGDSNNIQVTLGDTASTLASIFANFNSNNYTGLPISYRLSHLKDGSLAKIQGTDEYVVKEIKYSPTKVMSWDYLHTLIENKSIYKQSELKLDLTAFVNVKDPSKSKVDANEVVTVPDNINKLYLIGMNDTERDVEFNGLSVCVASRAAPIEIYLQKISFNGNSSQEAAIYSDCNAEVILNIWGDVTLKGSKNSFEEPNKAVAIKVNNLKIQNEDSKFANLTVKAGKDSNAIEVANNCIINMVGKIKVAGGLSYPGNEIGPVGIKAETVSLNTTENSTIAGGEGRDGDDGRDGNYSYYHNAHATDGQDGGNGGYAIVATTIDVKSSTFTLIGGNGGDGGDGGDGQKGESEWRDEDKLYYDGGNGGNAGDGGDGALPIEKLDSLTLNGNTIKLVVGSAGNGGKGGNGGDGEDYQASAWVAEWIIDGLDGGNNGSGGNGGDMYHYNTSNLPEGVEVEQELTAGKGGEKGSVGKKGKAYRIYGNHDSSADGIEGKDVSTSGVDGIVK